MSKVGLNLVGASYDDEVRTVPPPYGQSPLTQLDNLFLVGVAATAAWIIQR
jgi:hypothetical protein